MTGIVLKLPDLIQSMQQFEIKLQKNAKRIGEESDAWFGSYNLLPPKLFDEFVKCQFPLLAAYCYPDADDVRLRITADYTSILFTYDDLMDLPTGTLQDKVTADRAGQIIMSVFTNPHDFKPVPNLPVATAFHDFWLRFLATSTPACQRRFIDTHLEYCQAAASQVSNRETHRCPTIDEYIALRRCTSAIKVTYALIEYILEIDVPDEGFFHPAVDAYAEAANDVLCWANDIYSFDNEQARGDCHGLVAVVAINLNITVQAAIDHVNEMINGAIARMWRERANIPKFENPETDRIVQTYIQGIEVYLSGSVIWHLETERYFGSRVQRIKRSLIVDVQPLEEGVVSDFAYHYDRPLDLHTDGLSSAESSPPSSPESSSFDPSEITRSHSLIKGGEIKYRLSDIRPSAALETFWNALPIYMLALLPFVAYIALTSAPSFGRIFAPWAI